MRYLAEDFQPGPMRLQTSENIHKKACSKSMKTKHSKQVGFTGVASVCGVVFIGIGISPTSNTSGPFKTDLGKAWPSMARNQVELCQDPSKTKNQPRTRVQGEQSHRHWMINERDL